MKTTLNIFLICSLLLMNTIASSQIIDDLGANPISTRIISGYQFNPVVPTNIFGNWIVNSPNAYLVNENGGVDGNVFKSKLYVKWKNVEASAYPDSCVLQVQYTDNLGITRYVSRAVGPFNLTFNTLTFVGGSSRNVPCYSTTPITISLNNYVNTDNNYPFDKNLWITRHFEWTLPSGWQTTTGQTGTFVGLSSIVVIPPSSNSTISFSVRAKANTQYSQPSTLQITRNLENFSIEGPTTAACSSTKRYTAPASSTDVTYSWQLPSGWTGVANQNYIDATATGNSGSITCTMTGCGQSKVATKTVTVNIIEPGTSISGPDVIANYFSFYFIQALPEGSTILWNKSDNITRVSPQGSPFCDFKPNGVVSAPGWIEATIISACGNIPLPRKTVWVGEPDYTKLSTELQNEYLSACDYTSGTAKYLGSAWPGIDAYEWYMPNARNWTIEEESSFPIIAYKYVEIYYWENPAPYQEDIHINLSSI
jgi:hypothetical protein